LIRRWLVLVLVAWLVAGCVSHALPEQADPAGAAHELRLGYMPNLTHAQAVLGIHDGSLAEAAGVRIRPRLFTSGPALITALFAGAIDVAYVGPSPAVTGYVRSQGQALRIIAGAASGGAVLVVRPGVDPARLDGTRLATPGTANTQDVSLRHYLDGLGLRPRERGGTVTVTPLPPAEIMGLLARGHLDGAWVPEPWGAYLIREAGAGLVLDERDLWPGGRFPTTLVAVSTAYLQRHPEIVRGFLTGHVAITRWIQSHPEEARVRLQQALAALQGRALPDAVVADALSRIDFTIDPLPDAVAAQAQRAYDLGYLGARSPDLQGLFDLKLLKEVAP
jgi:NitT/TauT family transport system substrate-binding protein